MYGIQVDHVNQLFRPIVRFIPSRNAHLRSLSPTRRISLAIEQTGTHIETNNGASAKFSRRLALTTASLNASHLARKPGVLEDTWWFFAFHQKLTSKLLSKTSSIHHSLVHNSMTRNETIETRQNTRRQSNLSLVSFFFFSLINKYSKLDIQRYSMIIQGWNHHRTILTSSIRSSIKYISHLTIIRTRTNSSSFYSINL